MPKGYQHLTYEQRCQIYTLLKRGFSQTQIADDIGSTQSTVSREIRKNSGKRGYRYKQAHFITVVRRSKASSVNVKLTPDITFFIEAMLKERQWSPEQICGRMKLIYNLSISHERIYQYIWKDKANGGILYRYLRRKGKKYSSRGSKTSGRGLIPNRVGIELRPSIVDEKKRIGDFEVDTIVGARHQGAILNCG